MARLQIIYDQKFKVQLAIDLYPDVKAKEFRSTKGKKDHTATRKKTERLGKEKKT